MLDRALAMEWISGVNFFKGSDLPYWQPFCVYMCGEATSTGAYKQ